jgi:hypothetical protein
MSDSLIPPSITGKGSSFPPGGSVLDHAFGASDPYTLGVEEEYMLLDGETFDLVQHIDTVLEAVAGHELEPRINSSSGSGATSRTSRARRACASARRARIRSRSSRRSGSPPRTATARSSTRCSTSRGAS